MKLEHEKMGEGCRIRVNGKMSYFIKLWVQLKWAGRGDIIGEMRGFLGVLVGVLFRQQPSPFAFKLIIYFCFFINILMQEGHRNTQAYDSLRSQPDCEYVFLFKRIAANAGALEVRVDYSPSTSSSVSLDGHSQCFSVLPTFNRDHKFFTPSFILQEDMAKLEEKSSQFLQNHSNKVHEITEEKDELLVPKPSKNNRFCLICKETYEDYLTHISYPSHNRLLKESPFYNDIHEICSQRSPTGKFNQNKKIKKERKKRCTEAVPAKLKKSASQKSSEALSTGLQSSEYVQLCATAK